MSHTRKCAGSSQLDASLHVHICVSITRFVPETQEINIRFHFVGFPRIRNTATSRGAKRENSVENHRSPQAVRVTLVLDNRVGREVQHPLQGVTDALRCHFVRGRLVPQRQDVFLESGRRKEKKPPTQPVTILGNSSAASIMDAAKHDREIRSAKAARNYATPLVIKSPKREESKHKKESIAHLSENHESNAP